MSDTSTEPRQDGPQEGPTAPQDTSHPPRTSIGPRLAMLRRRRGLSQRRLAELLCAASGVATVSRNEVSRWERGLRTPAAPWLAWLSRVLQEPLTTDATPPGQAKRGPDGDDNADRAGDRVR